MNKLTAEKCREQFEEWFRDVDAGDDDNWSSPPYLSREWHDYLARRQLALGAWNKALEIALPVLDQQEVMSVPAFYIVYHPNPNPDVNDDKEHSECGSIHLARKLAAKIGETIRPVYVGPKMEPQEKGDDGWIEWKGGKQPIANDRELAIRFRDGSVMTETHSDCWVWSHGGDDDDIIAYRVVQQERERGEE